MTISALTHDLPETRTSPCFITLESDLVRGTENEILNLLLPLVREKSIALDLSGAHRIDAAGFAALIRLYCASLQSGQNFSVVAPSAHVLEMLRVLGLAPILLETEKAAGSPVHAPSSCIENFDPGIAVCAA